MANRSIVVWREARMHGYWIATRPVKVPWRVAAWRIVFSVNVPAIEPADADDGGLDGSHRRRSARCPH